MMFAAEEGQGRAAAERARRVARRRGADEDHPVPIQHRGPALGQAAALPRRHEHQQPIAAGRRARRRIDGEPLARQVDRLDGERLARPGQNRRNPRRRQRTEQPARQFGVARKGRVGVEHHAAPQFARQRRRRMGERESRDEAQANRRHASLSGQNAP